MENKDIAIALLFLVIMAFLTAMFYMVVNI